MQKNPAKCIYNYLSLYKIKFVSYLLGEYLTALLPVLLMCQREGVGAKHFRRYFTQVFPKVASSLPQTRERQQPYQPTPPPLKAITFNIYLSVCS